MYTVPFMLIEIIFLTSSLFIQKIQSLIVHQTILPKCEWSKGIALLNMPQQVACKVVLGYHQFPKAPNFPKLLSQKTVHLLEQIMYTDKYGQA